MAKFNVGQKGKRYVGVNLDNDVYAALEKRAALERRSVSNMVSFFIAGGVDTGTPEHRNTGTHAALIS